MSIFHVNKKVNVSAIIIAIIIPLAVGWLSSLFTTDSGMIYQGLEKPSFAPPAWVFAPVWSILYILMGLASYRIYMIGREGFNIRLQKFFYFTQLLFNFLWTIIFFNWQMYGVAFFELVFLLFLILVTAALFNNRDKKAAALLIPYILWVIYAGILNLSVWLQN